MRTKSTYIAETIFSFFFVRYDCCLKLSWLLKEGPRIKSNRPVRGILVGSLKVGRGDNLQLFISPLLKYEGWLYNIIDDKNFEINSLEPPCTGGLKISHTPWGPVEMQKIKILNFFFDCGKNVFQWTKKEPPRSFWLELFRFSVPYTAKYLKYGHFSWKQAFEAKSDAKGSKVVSQFNFKCHRGSFKYQEHILTIIDTLSEFSFWGFSIGPYGAMQKFRTPCTGGSENIFS